MVSRKSGTKKTVKGKGKQFTLDMVIAKKPTIKKTAAKKPTTKKPIAVKKTTVKKTATKKPTVKKSTAMKPTAMKIVSYDVEDNYDFDRSGIKSLEKARVIAANHCDYGKVMDIIGYNADHDMRYFETLMWDDPTGKYKNPNYFDCYIVRRIDYLTANEHREYCKIDPKTGKIIDIKDSYRKYFHYNGWA